MLTNLYSIDFKYESENRKEKIDSNENETTQKTKHISCVALH